MTESAREAKREYEKRWRAANPDKVKSKNQRYWERRAAKRNKTEGEAKNNETVSENTGSV